MPRAGKRIGRVIPSGKAFKIDFGRRYSKRYLYSFRGIVFENESLAEGMLAAIELEAAKAERSLEDIISEYGPPGASASIEHWLPRWLTLIEKATRANDLAPRTYREYSRWARPEPKSTPPENHFAYWSGRSIYDVSTASLREWSYELDTRGLSGKTRSNIMSGFSVFLTFVAENVHGFTVPKIPWPEKDEHVPTIISLELRDKVLTQINEADRGIFLALSWSGIRPHEARVLRVRDWQALEFDVSRSAKDRLTGTSADIRGPKKRKAKKRRAIASGGRAGDLFEWLERYVGAERRISDPDGPLFVNSNAYNDGGWWSETAMRRTWKAATVKAGVSVSLYEGTKHALGTAMKAAGVDDRVIADLFGHSDARSVLPYAKVQTAVVRNALGQLKRDPL
ncbi:MAG: site-specific integrase [Myxococcales bacterium]|nr:site-specific integrase [Myxococcales bacterium]